MLDEDRCWQALCERDAAFDGRFVFAVRSTGIFCRPSCPARRPARERVAFCRWRSGPRRRLSSCRRCSPMGPSPSEQLDALVVAACRLLDEATGPMTLPQLAARIGLSPTHLARAFKARTGLTPHAWATARRRERLDAQLPEAGSVLDAALAVGYSGTRAPYAEARALTPAQRRRKGAGETCAMPWRPVRSACCCLPATRASVPCCSAMTKARWSKAALALRRRRPAPRSGRAGRLAAGNRQPAGRTAARHPAAARPARNSLSAARHSRRCSRFPPARHAATASWRRPSAATRGRWRVPAPATRSACWYPATAWSAARTR